MKSFIRIRRGIKKISAITEKNMTMTFRYKMAYIFSFINPFVSILMPLIVLDKFLDYSSNFGPWTPKNYIIFVFSGYIILLLRKTIQSLPGQLRTEMFWKTLPALIIAPFNRYYLLFGYFLSDLLMISIPLLMFFIVLIVLFPISFFTILSLLFVLTLIALVFASIGLVLGVFSISNENIWYIMNFIISLIFWASCITYPFEIFPENIREIIRLNPIYYLIDILRYLWLEDNVLFTLQSHLVHTSFLFVFFFFPIAGVYTFNYIYSRTGITGY